MSAGEDRLAAVRASEASLSPAHWAMYTATAGKPWRPYRWHRLLNEKLLELAAAHVDLRTTGHTNRRRILIVSVSVRHGKTELGTLAFSAWWLGMFPYSSVIVGAYNATYAESLSRRVRNALAEHGRDVFGIELARDSTAVKKWNLAPPNTGMFTAVGAGTAPTGVGANLMVLDDPTKSIQEALSEAWQERVMEWYTFDMRPRLQDDGVIVLIQSRWGEKDLSGQLQTAAANAQLGEDVFEHVWLPALAEPTEDRPDLLGREWGEPLCHAQGTVICDAGKWMRVEDHHSFVAYRGGPGVRVHLRGLPGSETVTPDHLYWARQEARWEDWGARPRRKTAQADPGWVEAASLGRNHWIGLPIDRSEIEPEPIPHLVYDKGGRQPDGSSLPPRLNWRAELARCRELDDPEWWWFLGLWWGDGSLWGGLNVTVSDPSIKARVETLFRRYGRHFRVAQRQGCQQIIANHATLERWLKTEWVVGRCRKCPPSWVERLRLDYQRELLRGYHDADGDINKRSTTMSGYAARISSIHLPGLEACRRMFARFDIPTAIYAGRGGGESVICGRTVQTDPDYSLHLLTNTEAVGLGAQPRKRSPIGAFIEADHLWTRVARTEQVPDGETRFCPIQTDTESYTTRFGLSHNCPELWSREQLESLRDMPPPLGVGAIVFDSLYQNRPLPAEGGRFRRHDWRYCDRGEVPAELTTIRAWDLAATAKSAKKTDPDWTAGCLMGRAADGRIYVLDVRRTREEAADIQRLVRGTAIEDFELWNNRRVFVPQDPGQAGVAQVADYKKHVLPEFDVVSEPMTGDKVTRAMPLASQQRSNNVVLVRGPWNEGFVSEAGAFPRGGHDDMVDAAACGYDQVIGLTKTLVRVW